MRLSRQPSLEMKPRSAWLVDQADKCLELRDEADKCLAGHKLDLELTIETWLPVGLTVPLHSALSEW